MQEVDFDIIVGLHSIVEAIIAKKRAAQKLYLTEESKKEIQKKYNKHFKLVNDVEQVILAPHDVQEMAKNYYKKLGVEYTRVPSNTFLLANKLPTEDTVWLYNEIESNRVQKILCLDQVSDVHNGAALLRTASFYGVDAVVLPASKSFGLTPSVFRIASGATEHVPIVRASGLGKVMTKLQKLGVTCIGLSEHAPSPINKRLLEQAKLGVCLVLGKEETGISHSVMRVIKHQLSLTPQGETLSLNVSVAGAVAMEKVFGKK